MRLRTLLLLGGVLGIGFGIGFLLAPGAVLAIYGAGTDAAGLLMARFFGAALVQVGFVLFLARDVSEAPARHGLVLGSLLGSIAGLSVALSGQLAHLVNGLGWSTVAIYGLLLLGYGSFVFGKKAA